MGRWLAAAVFVLAVLTAPGTAYACTCSWVDVDAPGAGERRVAEEFAGADAVFVVEIVAVGPCRLVASRCSSTTPVQRAAATEVILNRLATPREPSPPQAPPHEDQVRAGLDERLRPIAGWRQRTEELLRRTAGTPNADAALLAARLQLKAMVAELATALETPEFQRIISPGGAAGQTYRRAHGVGFEAEASEVVRADALLTFMKDRGVWPRSAEGDIYFHVNEAALLEWFGPLVSEEIRTFLRLWADEQAAPVAEDASIQVPLEAVEQRILRTERFVADFPASAVREPVRARCQHYLALYLGGTDNTPVFDRTTQAIDAERWQRLQTFAVAHPELESGRTVARYLNLLRAQGFQRTREVARFLETVRGDPVGWRLRSY